MFLRIATLNSKKLVGKSIRMSLVDNKTAQLWGSFMPERMKVKNRIGNDFLSIQKYDEESYFQNFNPQTVFTKLAMVEVSEWEHIPEGMESMHLEEGLYAVFMHKGLPQDFPKTAQYIFSDWLPQSEYTLDHRPHFELLGEKYRNNDPSSEEEVWIPIRPKN